MLPVCAIRVTSRSVKGGCSDVGGTGWCVRKFPRCATSFVTFLKRVYCCCCCCCCVVVVVVVRRLQELVGV